VHYVQYQYFFLFYILLIWGCIHTQRTPRLWACLTQDKLQAESTRLGQQRIGMNSEMKLLQTLHLRVAYEARQFYVAFLPKISGLHKRQIAAKIWHRTG